MKKNLLTLVGTILTTSLLIAGCGQASGSAAPENTPAPAQETAEKTTETGSVETEAAPDATPDVTEKTTVVAVTHAAPRPFTYYDDNNNLTGQNVELINAIFERLPEYELVWEVSPDFPAIFAGLDSDKYQIGVNNLSWNEERGEKYIFTAPMFKNELIIVANGSFGVSGTVTYEDLAGKTYIGSPSIAYTAWVEQFNDKSDEDIKIEYNESDIALQLNIVSENEDYFTIIDAPMYYGYYQPEFNYDLPTAVLEDGSGEDFYSYFIVSKGNEKLADDINRVLLEITEDGTATKISEKYLGGDYAPSVDEIKSNS